MINCISIDGLDVDLTYSRRPAPLSTRLSMDIEDSISSSFSFLSPKATSIAHSKSSFVTPFDESLYTRFKSKIIQEKLTSNKKLHLQLRDQDEVIGTMREQIQNRSVMSFKSMDSIDVPCVDKTLNKLIKIEQNYLQRDKQKKKNTKRYRIQRKIKPQDKENVMVDDKIEFSQQDILAIKVLNPSLQRKINQLKISQNNLSNKFKQSLDVNERLQVNNKLHAQKIKSLNQKIEQLQSSNHDLIHKNQTLTLQNQELSRSADKLIERERFKYLYELDYQYSKQSEQLRRIGV